MGFFWHACKRAKAFYLIFPKYVAFGDAEQKRVGNLPSSTSHQNSDRLGLQHTRLLGAGGQKMTLELFRAHGEGVYSCQEDLLKLGTGKYRLASVHASALHNKHSAPVLNNFYQL